MSKKQQQIVDTLADRFGTEPQVIALKDIKAVADDLGYSYATLKMVVNADNKAGHGQYHFPPRNNVVQMPAAPKPQVSNVSLSMETNAFSENLVPEKDELFVPFGNFKVVRDIIKSKMFYPVFITGLSGNGKTYMVE